MRRTVHVSMDGRVWDLEITPDEQVLVHETIPPDPLNILLARNRELAIQWAGVPMIGNTQRHYQHIAEIPASLYWLWRSTLGDPSEPENAEAWEKALKRRLNDPDYRNFRIAGGRV